jgi:hypothetical protein
MTKKKSSRDAHNPGADLRDIAKKVTTLAAEQQFELSKEKIRERQSGTAEQLKLASERVVQLENQISQLLSVRGKTPQITTIPVKLPSGQSEAVAVMVASDWHVEENVELSATSGKNEFNLTIADSRITSFFQGSFRLFDILAKESSIKTVILALLGDFITNTIHEDLQESNNLLPSDAIYWAECRIASGIRFLLDHCPKDVELLIVCHSGNHGRMTKKQRGTTEAGNSLEHFMYHHLRDFFAAEKRIKFQIAEGYHTFTKLFNGAYTIRWHHGHAVQYQGGVGGITIPVNKAIAQWNTAHPEVALDVFGHFHQKLDGGTFIVNGSLIGYNDFGIRIKAKFEKPKQVFFTVAKRWNEKTVVTPIFLD